MHKKLCTCTRTRLHGRFWHAVSFVRIYVRINHCHCKSGFHYDLAFIMTCHCKSGFHYDLAFIMTCHCKSGFHFIIYLPLHYSPTTARVRAGSCAETHRFKELGYSLAISLNKKHSFRKTFKFAVSHGINIHSCSVKKNTLTVSMSNKIKKDKHSYSVALAEAAHSLAL